MHVLVLGATGRTGAHLLAESLERKHTVTALVRDPKKLSLTHPKLRVVAGSPLDSQALDTALSPFDGAAPSAVLVALASAPPTRMGGAPEQAHLMADIFSAVEAAMKRHAVRRITMLSAFGAGSSWAERGVLFKGVFGATRMKWGLNDHNEVERRARASGLDWVLVRASMLSDKDAKAVDVWGEEGKGASDWGSVSRGSVARFMVGCVEGEEWVGRTPVISD